MVRILLINTGSNVLVMLVKLTITFIMTPVLIHNLGNYDYGLWEMIGGIIGYMGMLDLGIRPAISRFAAKYQAEKDNRSLRIVFSTALCFMACVGGILLIFFIVWAVWFSSSVAQAGEPEQRYTLLLLILGGQVLITFPGYVAESYLEGFQKYYLKNNITIVNSILGGFILYLFIAPENGIVLLALVNAVGVSIKFFIYFLLLSRSGYGELAFELKNVSIEKLIEIIQFSFKSFIQGVATRIETATDALVIGFFLGPAMVPFYSIPANFVQYLRLIGWTLTHAFMPLFTNLDAMSEKEAIKRVFLLSSKYVVGIVFAIASCLVIMGGPFIGVWIGPEFQEKGELIIGLLVFFTVFPFINPFASRYLTAINKHAIFAKLTPMAAVVNISLSIVLVKSYGIVGVAFASTVAVIVFVPIYLSYTCKQIGFSSVYYLVECIIPCVIPTIVLAGTAFYLRSTWGLDSYIEIIAAGALSCLIWFLTFWFLSVSKDEKNKLLLILKNK